MKKYFTLISFFLFVELSFSQVTGGSALIPGELSWKLGLGGGFSYAFSSGSLYGKCDYDFKNLNGPGFYIAINGSMPLTFESDIYALFYYQSLKLESSANMIKLKAVENEPAPVLVNMESKAKIDISSINLNIYYKRKLFDEFFVIGGLGFHLFTSNEIDQNETIKDDQFVFSGSEKTSDLIYKGEIDEIKNFQFNLSVGMGYDFLIEYKYILTPMFTFNYPFTKLTSTSSLKIMSLNIGLQFSYLF